MTNQSSGFRAPNVGHDESVRPRMVGVWIVCLVVVAIGLAIDLRRRLEPVELVVAFVALGAAVLMAAGWAAALVPFVAHDEGPAPVAAAMPTGRDAAGADQPVPVRITGVVEDEAGRLRRYRHRAAILEGGRLLVEGLGGQGQGELARVRPDFGLEAISDPVLGTAWLASGGRPAIRLARHHGAVILAFDDVETRDLVFARVDGGNWPARPVEEPDTDADD